MSVTTIIADGSRQVFPYTFGIFSESELEIRIDGTVISQGFSIFGEGAGDGGYVNFITPPLAGSVVTLRRLGKTEVSDQDQPGFLEDKLVAGDNIAITKQADAYGESLVISAEFNGEDYLRKDQNLADLPDAGTARANLGVYSSTETDAAIAAAQPDLTPYARRDQNLADLTDIPTARANLDVYSTTEADAAIAAAQPDLTPYARRDQNLADLTDIPTARANLGVYSATETDAAIDAAQPDLIPYARRDQNLADLTHIPTARANLGVYSSAETEGVLTTLLEQSTNSRLDRLEYNLAITTLRDQIDAGWPVLKMIDGIADQFMDETGVRPRLINIAVDQGTPIGTLTYLGGLAAAFNGVTQQPYVSSARSAVSAFGGYIGKQWTAPKLIERFRAFSPSNARFVYGNSTANLTFQGSNDGSNWVNLWAQTGIVLSDGQVIDIRAENGLSVSTAYPYHRLYLSGTSNEAYCAELEMYAAEGESINAIHDSAGNYYHNPVTGTAVGNAVQNIAGTGYTWINRAASIPNNTVVTGLGVNLGTSSQTVKMYLVRRDAAGSYTAVVNVSGNTSGDGLTYLDLDTPYTIPATGTYYVAAYAATGVSGSEGNIAASQPRAIASGDVFSDGSQTGMTEDTNNCLQLGYQSPSLDMTLISQTFAAEIQPDGARMVLLHEPVDATTLNTDLIAEISRDGGTTWSAVQLAEEGPFDATTEILTGTADLSGQPPGTAMRWRISTFNNKHQRLHGVWMQWQ